MDKNKTPVSIDPSTFTTPKAVLDVTKKDALDGIRSMSFDAFLEDCASPQLTTNDYFDMRYIPDVWEACTDQLSRSHLFLYTYASMLNNPLLTEWRRVREEAKEICKAKAEGFEASLIWLNKRPKYALYMASSGTRINFPAWSETVKGWFMSETKKYRLTGRLLFIALSCDVLKDSGVPLGTYRTMIECEAGYFKDWMLKEIRKISTEFGIRSNAEKLGDALRR